jgi:hypothetical protein
MAYGVALEEGQSEKLENQSTGATASSLRVSDGGHRSSGVAHGVEALLTSNEVSQVLKIHPKVLERMAKRGEVPVLAAADKSMFLSKPRKAVPRCNHGIGVLRAVQTHAGACAPTVPGIAQ